MKNADKQTRLGIRKVERQVAEPVKREAQELAVREISRIGTPWSTMRIGITQKVVYVAPKQRGNKARRATVSQARRRADQKFATRLMDRAMEPALEHNRAEIELAMEEAIDKMADNFNRGV